MSYESFRLLHVHAPRLDAALGDLLGLPGIHTQLVQDATLNAFDHAIEAAIEHHVDLVLLTGAMFGETTPTLRGLARLRDALSVLDEEEIAVYISCEEKIQQALRDGPWLGHGAVTLMSPFQKQPLPLEKNRQKLASVSFRQPIHGEKSYRFDPPQGLYDKPAHLRVTGSSLFSILIQQSSGGEASSSSQEELQADLIIRCGDEFVMQPAGRTIEEIVAGPLQGIGRQHVGPMGCSLVVVDERKDVRVSFIPCHVVQREHVPIRQHVGMDERQLLTSMQQQLDLIKVHQGCRLLVCEWDLVGYDDSGRQSPSTESVRSRLARRRHASSTTEAWEGWQSRGEFSFEQLVFRGSQTCQVWHRFSASDELRLPRLLDRHQLAQEYLKLAEDFFPEEIGAFETHLAQWAEHLPSQLASRMHDVNADKLIEFAVNYGTHWFVQAAEEVAA